MKILKLTTDKGRWSFLDGYQIYDYVVYLLNEDDVRKYTLIDDDGNVIYKPTINDIVYQEF
jgi:hypothetical protein